MTKEELEKEAEDKGVEYADKQKRTISVHEDNGYSWGQVEQAYEQGALDFAEPREKQITALGERCLQLQKDKGNLTDRVKELEAQIEKLIDFVLSKTECCDVCPITDTCINSEGTCPYAGILAKCEEEVTREWLMQFISKEIKEK